MSSHRDKTGSEAAGPRNQSPSKYSLAYLFFPPLVKICSGTLSREQVLLINNAPFEVAVDLRIDGINIFEFSETNSQYYIVGSGKFVDVLGWHKTTKQDFVWLLARNRICSDKTRLIPSSSIPS